MGSEESGNARVVSLKNQQKSGIIVGTYHHGLNPPTPKPLLLAQSGVRDLIGCDDGL
jgi:hypothetical protein